MVQTEPAYLSKTLCTRCKQLLRSSTVVAEAKRLRGFAHRDDIKTAFEFHLADDRQMTKVPPNSVELLVKAHNPPSWDDHRICSKFSCEKGEGDNFEFFTHGVESSKWCSVSRYLRERRSR